MALSLFYAEGLSGRLLKIEGEWFSREVNEQKRTPEASTL